MKRLRSILACAATAAILGAGATGAAYADTAAANGDVAATNNSGNLKFGNVACNSDNAGTTTLWVVRKSANNKENFANGATVTFTVKSVEGAGVTASSPTTLITLPSNWLKKDDDTVSNSVTAPIHLLSTVQGAGTGKVTYEARGAKDGGGTLALSTFVNVSWTTGPCATNTPPTVTVVGPQSGGSYEYGQAPSATCNVTDKEDGASSFPATVTPGGDVVDGIGTYTASCSYTDSGGLKADSSVTYSVSKIPTSMVLNCPKAPLTYTGSAHEPCTAVVSGRDLPSDTKATITYENNINAGTATATANYVGDNHYGASSASTTFKIDPAPSSVTITCKTDLVYTGEDLTPCTAVASGAGMTDLSVPVNFPEVRNAGTWTATASWEGDANHYGSNSEQDYTIDKATSTVTITCKTGLVYTGGDLTPCSAVASGAGMTDLSVPVNHPEVRNAGTWTATARWDGDDNHYGSDDSKAYTIEKAPSTVAIYCPPSVWYTGTPVTPCSATVTGAGVVTGEPVISYSGNDKYGIATATATYAGDANHFGDTKIATFQVNQITRSGFYKPVDMNTLNTVKAGSTVPLKFEVFMNGVERTDTTVVESFTVGTVACGSLTSAEDPVDFTTTGGTSLRYDMTGGQFIQNWQTPKAAGSCYRVTMTTKDGGALTANFKLK